MERNPAFQHNGGRVSVLGHSLGSVISFDVLTGMHANEYTSMSPDDPSDTDQLRQIKAQLRELERELERVKSYVDWDATKRTGDRCQKRQNRTDGGLEKECSGKVEGDMKHLKW